MTMDYNTALRTQQMQDLIDDTDAGGAGQLVLLASAQQTINGAATGPILGNVTLPVPSGVAAAGVWTLQGTPLSTTAIGGGGTIQSFRILDNGGTAIAGGTAGTSGTDLILDSATVSDGDTININSGQITNGNA